MLEALPDNDAARILAEREGLGRLVQDLFKARADGEAMIAQVAADTGMDPDDLRVDDASVTFTWAADGKTYRLTLGEERADDSATIAVDLADFDFSEPEA